jgi:hypothetical protein
VASPPQPSVSMSTVETTVSVIREDDFIYGSS